MVDKLAIARLRNFLAKEIGCELQKGWSCGTCFMAYLNRLGLDDRNKKYKIHNDPVERHNEIWRAILQIRENDMFYKRSQKDERIYLKTLKKKVKK